MLNLPDAPWTRTLSIGVNDSNDLVIDNFKENAKGSSFDLVWREQQVWEINWSMPGLFNARNLAMACLSSALVQSLGRDLSEILENPFRGIKEIDYESCRGVKRRQEVLVNRDDVAVLSDFAHHPTAITGALESLRARWPDRQIIACFEPRSNTAVTNIFQQRFAQSLSLADHALIGQVHRAERIPHNERINPSRDSPIY